MSKINKTVCLDEDIVFNPKYLEATRKGSLSSLINNLLRVHFNMIKGEDYNTFDVEDLKNKIISLDVEKNKIINKIEDIENSKPKLTPQEIAEGWFLDDEGVKWKRSRPINQR